MVAFPVLATLLGLALPLIVVAGVTPSEPGPGSIFKAGSPCLITWDGDTDSTTIWKNMAIELMSGDNINMVHVTTVATNQDGTKDGSFQYTCPEVDPYSDIYFYQFSANDTSTKTWTTRFTIESAQGNSTPPANSTQPTGEPIPWGVGHLVDINAEVPPPFSNSTSSGANPLSSSSPSPTNGFILTSSSSLFSSSSPAPSTSSVSSTSGALAKAVNNRRAWMIASGALGAIFF